VLRGIFIPKWQNAGENYIMRHLYFSADITVMLKSRRMALAWHVACILEMKIVYTVLVGESEGKGPLGRPRCR
jgi:hypothetical protein